MTVVLWDVNRFLGRWPTAELAYHDLAGLLADMDRLGIARATLYQKLADHPELAAGAAPAGQPA